MEPISQILPGAVTQAAGLPQSKNGTAEPEKPNDEQSTAAWLKEVQSRIAGYVSEMDSVPVENKSVVNPGKCPFENRECKYCESGKRSLYYYGDEVRKIYDVSACYRQVVYTQLLSKSNMSGEQLKETFENAVIDKHNKELFTFLQQWDYKSGQGIYIAAAKDKNNPQGNGTGKSYALNALACKLLNQGVPCYFAKTIEFLNQLKNSYSEDSPENEMYILDKYINVPVLFWDDMGKESIRKDTSWGPEKIYYVIDERIKRQKPLVISSNFEIHELEPHFGETNHGPAIISRLVKHCKENYFVLGGPDRRF